jgi:hypothetical protein
MIGPGRPVVDADISTQNLARVFFQRGLVLEGLHLADPAGIEDRDDGFRASLEMRRLRRKGVSGDLRRGTNIERRRLGARKQVLIVEHLSEGQPRDAATGLKQKIATIPDVFSFRLPRV